MVQVAVRTPKKKGGYSYSVLVTTRLDATLDEIVTDYDKRSGVSESTFCQDYQGLAVRKRRKGGFVAQKVLGLLSHHSEKKYASAKGEGLLLCNGRAY